MEWIEKLQAIRNENKDSPAMNYLTSVHPFVTNYLSFYYKDLGERVKYRCGWVKDSKTENLYFMQIFESKNAKNHLFFVHGYLDHSGGNSRFIQHALKKGNTVVTIDLPGHGFSEGEAGDENSFTNYLSAVTLGFKEAKKQFPHAIWTACGHSTGAAILFHAQASQRIKANNMILVAPLYIPFRWNITGTFIKLTGKWLKEKKRSFKKNSLDTEYRIFIKSDPLQLRYLTSEWVRSMEKWQREIKKAPVVHIPVYIIQGGLDQTIDSKETINFYSSKCSTKQIMWIPNGRHQLLNEAAPIREQIYKQVDTFIEDERN